MKYICSTCGQQINDWPLTRPGFKYEYWCTTECLIEFQQQLDEQYQESERKL